MLGPDGQRHHLLLGAADWGTARLPGGDTLASIWAQPPLARPDTAPAWDSDRHAIALAPRRNDIIASAGDRPLDPAARRAAAADAAGNIYWLGDDPAQIWVASAGDGSVARFWPDPRSGPVATGLFQPAAPPPAAPAFSALCVTCDGWLVAGGGGRLLAFDLIGGGPPAAVSLPPGITAISVLAAAPDAGLWLLDADTQALWRFGPGLVAEPGPPQPPQAPLFAPAGSAPPAPPAPTPPAGHALAPFAAAVRDLAVLPDGRLLLLAGAELLLLAPAPLAVLDRVAVPAGIQAIAAGRVRLRSGPSPLRLVASLKGGNQAIAFAVDGDKLVATTETLPLRAHRGRALLGTPAGLAFDSGDRPIWAPIVEQPRRSVQLQAVLETPLFDAGLPGCVWDRLFLDGCLPPGTSIRVEARCGDDPAALGEWTAQPSPILSPSGGELVAHGPAAVVPTDRTQGRGSLVMLCQQMTGRHAQLRLTLASDGQASPHVFALRLHYPRVSWNDRFLPAVYREDADAGDFLSRWLANMAGVSDQIDRRIALAQRWLCAASVPQDALPWLAGWFDVALDPAWDEARRRAFIGHAMRFFAWRGTLKGLTAALALGFNQRLDGTLFADDDCTCEHAIRIVEHHRTRSLAAADRLAAADAAVAAEAAAWAALQRQRGRTSPLPLPASAVPAGPDWAAFLAIPSEPRTLWQRFLAARWRRISLLNQAHGGNWPDFAAISLPPATPATAQARADWQDYVGTLLPIGQSAHRFSVLLPIRPGEPTDTATLDTRRRLAERLIALEKPAHTIFDVRFWFAMNRIGEARLGLDTTLGQGARAPELLPPAILGRAYAGEAFIGPDGPSANDRRRLAC